MKQVMLLIDVCPECPFCDSDNQEREEFWGKYSCEQLDIVVPEDGIHPDCPLDDVSRV